MKKRPQPKRPRLKTATPRRAASVEPLYTAEEIAENVRVSVETVKRKARSGEWPSIRVSKRGDMRFDLNEVRIAIERASASMKKSA